MLVDCMSDFYRVIEPGFADAAKRDENLQTSCGNSRFWNQRDVVLSDGHDVFQNSVEKRAVTVVVGVFHVNSSRACQTATVG